MSNLHKQYPVLAAYKINFFKGWFFLKSLYLQIGSAMRNIIITDALLLGIHSKKHCIIPVFLTFISIRRAFSVFTSVSDWYIPHSHHDLYQTGISQHSHLYHWYFPTFTSVSHQYFPTLTSVSLIFPNIHVCITSIFPNIHICITLIFPNIHVGITPVFLTFTSACSHSQSPRQHLQKKRKEITCMCSQNQLAGNGRVGERGVTELSQEMSDH